MLHRVQTLLYARFCVKRFICGIACAFFALSLLMPNTLHASPKKTPVIAPTKTVSVAKKTVKTQKENLLIRVIKMKDFDRIAFDWEAYTKFDLNRTKDTIQILFNKKADIDIAHIQKKLPKRITGFEQIETDTGIGFILNLAKNSGVRPFRFDNKVMLDVFNKKKPIGGKQDILKASSVTKTEAGTTIITPTPQKTPVRNLIKKTDTMIIPSDVGAALAVFRKDAYIWIVSNQVVDFNEIKTKSPKTKDALQRLASPIGTAMRLPIAENINPSVSRDGRTWVIDFKKQKIRPNFFVPIKAINENLLSLKIVDTVASVKINDPDTGDVIEVIPVIKPDYGIDGTRDFVVFSLFESAQGIAILHKMTGLIVKRKAREISISRKKGLFLSLSLFEEEKRESKNVLDIAEWQKLGFIEGEKNGFMPQKRRLQNQLRQAKRELKNKYRFKLAQLAFAYGVWDQSLAIFKVIAKDNPRFLHKPQLRAMTGASYYLAGRNKKALTILEDLRSAKREYKKSASLSLWLGAIHFKENNYRKAYDLFQHAKEVPAYYPDSYRVKLATKIAENFIYGRQPKAGINFVEKFMKDMPAAAHKFMLVKAKLLRAHDDHKGALETLKPLLLSQDIWVRANAWHLYTTWRLGRRHITVSKAINEFERQRFLWRGDLHEFNLLYDLAHLHLREKNYRKGMTYLRKTVQLFPTHPKVKEIVKTLAETFYQLFYEGEADHMPALASLALFNDFRELIPADKEGDEIVKKMVDKLLLLDLLDRAAILLEHQVKYRLKGNDLAEHGAKLANVYLDNNQPLQAEMALIKSGYGRMPTALLHKRKKLLARALMEQGRYIIALKEIRHLHDKASKVLRVEINWHAQNWSKVARSIQVIIQRAEAPYDREMREFIVNCAVALTLSGDEYKIGALQRKYGKGMREGYLSADFSAITDKNINASSFADFVLRFKTVEKFQGFLESYRKRL
ncbi:MAG: tetratricopeptide repeat protein [Alphaproteobacteria bacterium]